MSVGSIGNEVNPVLVGDSADQCVSSVADRFERAMGSRFLVLFAPALFDEMMLPAVSASLVDTARIRDDPFARGLRTAASFQLTFMANDVDRREEMQRLVRLHRDIKGVGPDGVRYSAMSPEPWNWNLISIFFMHRGAFMAITGEKLSAADNQAIWDRYRALTKDLEMPGRARKLTDRFDELSEYYDQMATEKLRRTEALDIVVDALRRPRRPEHMSVLTEPLWRLLGPLGGHLAAVLGFGIMHPRVRAILPMRWTRRHELEFAVLTRLVQIAYRWLPRRLTDTPLAGRTCDYARIVNHYKGIGLTSFIPGATETCGHASGK
jgi:uncharacterized protein (DUF2236 family)